MKGSRYILDRISDRLNTSLVCLRCYVDHGKSTQTNHSFGNTDVIGSNNATRQNNSILLVFDTETTADEYQNLKFGSCCIWVNAQLKHRYIFHTDIIDQSELDTINFMASKYGYAVLSRQTFVENVFYPYVYWMRARCAGFNLPFDLTRLAISFTPSRKYKDGFSLVLTTNPVFPRINIKSINTKASFIEFNAPLRKKSERKKKRPHYKGCFIDLKTATFALTNASYTLEKALEDFECTHRKIEVGGQHGKITTDYIKYNLNDIEGTYELYAKVLERYNLYRLDKDINKLYSPASIGKAYHEKIGILPFFTKNPDFPKEMLGYVMQTYYGGMTANWRRKIPTEVANLDFTSMYPTIYALLNLDAFLKADKIGYRDSIKETQALLERITLDNITKDKHLWQSLTTICKVVPDDDILPVRSRYGSKNTWNIGVNYLKSLDGTGIWYTLSDVLASKIRTGKVPKILQAITFYPQGIQQGLQEIEILKGITVKPNEDFIKKLIEERLRIKQQTKKLIDPEQKKQADLKQQILKIIANSTSYGIFIEINSEDADDGKPIIVDVYGLDKFQAIVKRIEREGKAFNPIMAPFITATSRLILAITEVLVQKHGGYLAYCDTDSALVSPRHVKLIQQFFKPLNPYSENVEMFKVEDDDEGKPLDNVLFYGISSKRYVLYDIDPVIGQIKIRKYSSHGLGHLIGVDEKQWWTDILAVHYQPELMDTIKSKYRGKYAVSQLTIRSYEIFKRFKNFNSEKPLSKQIKPFNFITVGQGHQLDHETGKPIIPMLPYTPHQVNGKLNKRFEQIPYLLFIDYKQDRKYSEDTELYWKTLDRVFEDYINHPESKFDGSIGLLQRKNLKFDKLSIRYIGKESNELEEAETVGVDEDDYTEYTNTKHVIANEMKEKNAVKSGIPRATYYYWKKKFRK